MSNQKELTLEEMLKLAGKVKDWEFYHIDKNGRTYKGNIEGIEVRLSSFGKYIGIGVNTSHCAIYTTTYDKEGGAEKEICQLNDLIEKLDDRYKVQIEKEIEHAREVMRKLLAEGEGK